jgi:hypothetical protein
MGVQEVRWDRVALKQLGDYSFFYGSGNENHELRIEFFIHKVIILSDKREEFFSNTMS